MSDTECLSFINLAVVSAYTFTKSENILDKHEDNEKLRRLRVLQEHQPSKVSLSLLNSGFILGLAYYGSTGEAVNEMEDHLRITRDTLKEVSDITECFKNANGVPCEINSRIYVQNGLNVNKDLIKFVEEDLKGKVKPIDFAKMNETVEDINYWVTSGTKDRLTFDYDDITPENDVLMLTTCHFSGQWRYRLHLKKDQFFHDTNNFTQLEFITMVENFRYKKATDLLAEVVEIPFYKQKVSMFFILPFENTSTDDVCRRLAEAEKVDDLLVDTGEEKLLYVSFPKLTITKEIPLKDFLYILNCDSMFDRNKLCFANILEGVSNLVGDRAFQKIYFSINEQCLPENSKEDSSISRSDCTRFEANRPFIMMITDKTGKYKNILLYDLVQNPAERPPSRIRHTGSMEIR